ncbi:metallophosphoesterase [Pseudoalteromonas lipolytica]
MQLKRNQFYLFLLFTTLFLTACGEENEQSASFAASIEEVQSSISGDNDEHEQSASFAASIEEVQSSISGDNDEHEQSAPFVVSIEGMQSPISGDQAVVVTARVDSGINAQYEWLLDGETVATTQSYHFSGLADGNYTLMLIAKDIDSNHQVSADFHFTVTGRSNQAVFFDYGSKWHYFDDKQQEVANNWMNTDFDDSVWQQGESLFAYGKSYQYGTDLAEHFDSDQSSQNESQYYFRKTIHVDNINALNDMQLNLRLDCKAVIYVNGQDVARTPLMYKHNQPYTPSVRPDEGTEFNISIVIPASAFVEGENTLAIKVVHTPVDADEGFYANVFDASLTNVASLANNIDGPYVFYRDEKVVVKALTGTEVLQQSYDSLEDAKVTVILPDNLGQFDVELQKDFTVEPYLYDKPEKFFVTSDIEGNVQALVYMLIQAGVMDEQFNWTYGDGHLYNLGDLFDRGPYVAESLWLFYHLEKQAKAAGGDFHFIVGNHDFMNLYGDWRYLHQRYFRNPGLFGEPLIGLYGDDTELGRWLRSKNIMERAGDVLFVHAGLKTTIIDAVESGELKLEQINDYGRGHMDTGYSHYKNEDFLRYLPSRLYWDRSVPYGEMSQQDLDRGLMVFGADKMLIGHTILRDEQDVPYNRPVHLYNDKVLNIDFPHNDNLAEGYVQAMEFENGNYYHFKASKTQGVTRTLVEPSTAN